MIRYVLPLVVLSPYINIWPFLAAFGVLCVVGFIIGWYTNRNKVKLPTRTIKSQFAFNFKPPIVTVASKFQHKIQSFLLENIKSELLARTGFQLHDQLQEKTKSISEMIVALVQHIKLNQIHERILQIAFQTLGKHVQQYKKLRKEVGTIDNDTVEIGHLDDFNEFSVESKDRVSQYFQQLDKINNEIVNRLIVQGKLHPGIDDPVNHMRSLFQRISKSVKKRHWTRSKIVSIIVREWIICVWIYPLFNKIAKPDFINHKLVESANNRISFLKSVKSFKLMLDSAFTQFPPYFLLTKKGASAVSSHMDLQRKLDLINTTIRYSKEMRSLVDLTALMHGVTFELKRLNDKMSEYQVIPDILDRSEQARKYYELKKTHQHFQALKHKLLKRLSTFSDEDSSPLGSTQYQNDKPSLESILDSHYQSFLDQGVSHSIVYFFVEFLEKQSDTTNGTAKLRFWLHAESYKRLVSRLSTGILSKEGTAMENEDDQVETLSIEAHDRLRKDVEQIYIKFVSPISGCFPSYILDSFERYIAPLLSKEIFESNIDDYQCVMKAQELVFNNLQTLYQKFLHSESYFKWSSEQEKSKLSLRGLNERAVNSTNFSKSNLMKHLSRELENCINQDSKTSRKHAEAIDNEAGLMDTEDLMSDLNGTQIDHEIIAPGELLTRTSKLSEIKDAVESLISRIDCVALLEWHLKETRKPNEEKLLLVLDQAKESLRQEVGELTKQKAKYASQEQREAIQPGIVTVSIESIEEPDDEVTWYIINVVKNDTEKGWSLKRRYSDFDRLHRKLKQEFPIVLQYDLPAKTHSLFQKKQEAKNYRTRALEKYLQRLIDTPGICQSEHLLNFLSSNYQSSNRSKLFQFSDVKGGMRGKFQDTLNNFRLKSKERKSVRDFISETKRNFKKALKSDDEEIQEFKGKSGHQRNESEANNEKSNLQLDFKPEKDNIFEEPDVSFQIESMDSISSLAVQCEGNVFNEDSNVWSDSSMDKDELLDIAPINLEFPVLLSALECLLECFEFKGQTFLRHSQVMQIFENIFGKDMMEKNVKEYVKSLVREESLCKLFDMDLFSQGEGNPRIEARYKLDCFTGLMPTIESNVARAGFCELHDMFQNEVLNRHLVLTLIDQVVQLI